MTKSYLKLFILTILITNILNLSKANTIKIAVLKYGSVNWEYDVIKYHGLDKKNNIKIKKLRLPIKMLLQLLFCQSR